MPAKSSQPLFSRKTFDFLTQLAANNNRDWFNAHREEYEAHVRTPALNFIAASEPGLRRLSAHFIASAKRSGGSLMRIHRDMRFSRDKSPYKTNIGIQFRHARGRDVHAPGYYLHIEPGGCFVGAGIWRPEASALNAIRLEIADRPKDWQKATQRKIFRDSLSLSGEQLSRPPRGYARDAINIDDLRRKDFIAVGALSDSVVKRSDIHRTTEKLYRRANGLMQFLCAALDLEF